MVFDAYAAYYDLLYTDKDYRSEADYVHQLIQINSSTGTSILDLGCGTGKHAAEFEKLGYSVVGVDRAANMIAIARQQSATTHVSFLQGDIRTIRTGKRFDAVVSLFHVMSYMVTDAELQQAFETAAVHMADGALFIFDCWYGPGVVSDPPFVATKKMNDANVDITRTATPLVYPDKNLVQVDFEVAVTEKENSHVYHIHEQHTMRYLFKEEIKQLAQQNGMKILAAYKWLGFEEIAEQQCWNAVFILKKL